MAPRRHGRKSTQRFFNQLEKRRRDSTTIVVEELPQHFPGGEYRRDGVYPPMIVGNGSSSNLLCDTVALQSGTTNISAKLEDLAKAFKLLLVAHFYLNRGDAHIGNISPDTQMGPTGWDCVHWCVAPGVLDVLALQTLIALK